MAITLTEREESLFNLFLEVVDHYQMGTVLRVAGGWVRDKVLQKASDDIDVTCSNCTGQEFAQKLLDYCNNVNSKYSGACGHVGVIKANPEHSKHLETTSLMVLGYSIDFCNLRCEEYSKESRIPVTVFFFFFGFIYLIFCFVVI